MSRLLVAGASGLIGTALCRHPRIEAAQPWTASRGRLQGPRHLPADLSVSGEAEDVLRAARPDIVFLLAGGAAADRLDLYSRNVLPTVNLLAGAAHLDEAPYFIVLGSASEYGDGVGTPIGEDTPPCPVSAYGRAKLAQTALAQGLAVREGIPLTIVRPFNVVSPDLPPTTALGNMRTQLAGQTTTRRTIVCGRLDVVRDYVHIGFLVDVLAALTAKPLPGQVVNVCSGRGIRLGDVLAAMGRLLGVELDVSVDETLAGLPAADVVVGNPGRLETELGLSHRPTPDGIAALMLGRKERLSAG